MISMGPKRKDYIGRREVPDTLTKKFYKSGGGEALLGVIAAATATYGGSVRSRLFDELRELGGGIKNKGDSPHVPVVTLSPGRALGQVSVEITAPGDGIDYIWATDADSGEIFAGRKFTSRETPSLVLIVARGRRIVPSVHSTRDGVWDGEAIEANA